MEVKIIDIAESSRLDKRGSFEKIMVASFEVGDLGPFTEEMPLVQFTRDKMMEQIEKRADEIKKLYGSE